jgi:hypothetical protein
MDIDDERIKDAVEHTEIIRLPKQSLATFGTTNIGYYLLTVPAYADLVKDIAETADCYPLLPIPLGGIQR